MCTLLNAVGVASLVVLANLTVVDVLGRYLLNRPLVGALELSELLMSVLVFLGLARAELQEAHVTVTVVVARLSRRPQAWFDCAAALVGTGFWGLVAWRTAIQAWRVQLAGEVSSNLLLPIFPFVYVAALGSSVLALLLLRRTLLALARAANR